MFKHMIYSVYFLLVNERTAFSVLWRTLGNCSAFYHSYEGIFWSWKMSLLLTVLLLTHFSHPRGETWQSCYVAKEVWCLPWRSSSCTGSNLTVFSRGTCLFGTLWVSTLNLSRLKVMFHFSLMSASCLHLVVMNMNFTYIKLHATKHDWYVFPPLSTVFVFYHSIISYCQQMNKWWTMTNCFPQRRLWFSWRQLIRWVTCMDQH